MARNELSESIGIEIAGTFDIAVTRQHIRRLSEELKWPPTLRLRAIAALTALAETVYFRDRQREEPFVVYIQIVEQDGARGIEFHADVDFDAILRQYPAARWQLERVSDELKIEHEDDADQIIMWVGGRS